MHSGKSSNRYCGVWTERGAKRLVATAHRSFSADEMRQNFMPRKRGLGRPRAVRAAGDIGKPATELSRRSRRERVWGRILINNGWILKARYLEVTEAIMMGLNAILKGQFFMAGSREGDEEARVRRDRSERFSMGLQHREPVLCIQ